MRDHQKQVHGMLWWVRITLGQSAGNQKNQKGFGWTEENARIWGQTREIESVAVRRHLLERVVSCQNIQHLLMPVLEQSFLSYRNVDAATPISVYGLE